MNNPSNPWGGPVEEASLDEGAVGDEQSSEHFDEVTDEAAALAEPDAAASDVAEPGLVETDVAESPASDAGVVADQGWAPALQVPAEPLISSTLAPKLTVEEEPTAPSPAAQVTDFTLPAASVAPPAPSGYPQPAAGGYAQPTVGGYAQPTVGGYAQPTPGGYGQPTPGGYAQPAQAPYAQSAQAPHAEPAYQQPPFTAGQPAARGYGQQPPAPGYPVQPVPGGYQAAYSGLAPGEEAVWASAAHWSALVASAVGLGFLGPLIIMLTQGPKSARVRANAVESLNFEITFILSMIVSAILMVVLVGFVLLMVIPLVWLILRIIASIQTANGRDYRYPLNIRFVK